MIPILKSTQDLSRIFNRTQLDVASVNADVKAIIASVREQGDAAVFAYTKKFDGFEVTAQNLKLTEKEIKEAVDSVDKKTLSALLAAKENIIAYHKRQLPQENFEHKNGAATGYIYRPVSTAGIYIPGGKAAYPSSVLMCALPAMVAGVERIVMVTPPGKYLNALTIAAAHVCGISEIYRVGGAQAIAALAYGTQSIPRADVITGPGNIYVAAAKKEIFGAAGIDMIAGPSEILIIADKTANPHFVAADMLGQAEHDELAQSILLTTDEALAHQVNVALEEQLSRLPKKEIAQKSLEIYAAIVVCQTLSEAAVLSNRIAPEHLELCVKDPDGLLKEIKHAGAVFMGHYSPESLGDYYAGTNHVLPTSSTARFSQGLGVDTYLKRIGVVHYTRDALLKAADDIIALATAEDLDAHAEAVRVRKNA